MNDEQNKGFRFDVRLPLVTYLQTRDTAMTKDAVLVNSYIEPVEGGNPMVVKRPGLSLSFNTAIGQAQGLDHRNGIISAVVSDVLYRSSTQSAATNGSAFTSSPPPWRARNRLASVVFQKRLFIFSGSTNLPVVQIGDIWSTADGVNWMLQGGVSPFGRRDSTVAVAYRNRIWIAGGFDNSTGATNDVWSSADTVNWTRETSAAQWPVRSHHGFIVFNDVMLIFGGQAAGVFYNDVWGSTDGKTWAQVATAGWSARDRFAFVVFKGRLYVIAGRDAVGSRNDVWSTADGVAWTQDTAAAFATARQEVAATVYQNAIYVVGGATADIHSSTDGIAYTLIGSPLPATSSPRLEVFSVPYTVNTYRYETLWLLGGDTATAHSYYGNLNQTTATSYALTPITTLQARYYFNTLRDGQVYVIKNQSNMWMLDGANFAKVTSPNYPTETVDGIAVLDRTLYVMDRKGIIYGSDISDVTKWSALNFITADYSDDEGVFIGKHLNYVLALSKQSTQFFFDAGNPFGSPLTPVTNANQNIGCVSGTSVVQIGNTYIFVAQTAQRGRFIAMLDGLNVVPISTQWIERILDPVPITQFRAISVRLNGHTFYLLHIPGQVRTYCYDLTTKMWVGYWQSSGSNVFFGWDQASDGVTEYVLDRTNGKVYSMSTETYLDDATNIAVSITTPLWDNGNNRRKFCCRAEFIGDRVSADALLSWTDDDYQTFSGTKTLTLSLARPSTWRLGSFRRRAFRLTHTANTAFRGEALELRIVQGL